LGEDLFGHPVLLHSLYLTKYCNYLILSGPGSSVGIATGWTVRRSNSAPVQTGPGADPASRTMGTESFPGVESGRGVTLTPHPLLVPRSKNRIELCLYFP
jgi:hypothetical protein